MTRVDFYLVGEDRAGQKGLAICRLAHKAHELGHRVYILAEDLQQARELDRLLWTFTDLSFVPHALNSHGVDMDLPVLIGDSEPPASFDDVLITLAAEVPACFQRFKRVAEVVGPAEEERQRARERFRFYRARGYSPGTHNL